MVSTRKNRGKKGGRLSRTMRGGALYNVYYIDDVNRVRPYESYDTKSRISRKDMTGVDAGQRVMAGLGLSGKMTPPEKIEVKSVQYFNSLDHKPSNLYIAKAKLHSDKPRETIYIARYRNVNNGRRMFENATGEANRAQLTHETDFITDRSDEVDQRQNFFSVGESGQTRVEAVQLPHHAPRLSNDDLYHDADSNRDSFGSGRSSSMSVGGRRKTRRNNRKKNPHKKKKGSKHVKSKNKRKTRKNMHGGGEAYYVVTWNSGGKVFPIASGHVYSRVLPSDFGWVVPHELHTAATILKKKIENEMDHRNHKKTLLDIVLENAQIRNYELDTQDKLKDPSEWTHTSNYGSQSITNRGYKIQRYYQRPTPGR